MSWGVVPARSTEVSRTVLWLNFPLCACQKCPLKQGARREKRVWLFEAWFFRAGTFPSELYITCRGETEPLGSSINNFIQMELQ